LAAFGVGVAIGESGVLDPVLDPIFGGSNAAPAGNASTSAGTGGDSSSTGDSSSADSSPGSQDSRSSTASSALGHFDPLGADPSSGQSGSVQNHWQQLEEAAQTDSDAIQNLNTSQRGSP
jgi:hypothetical protein